MRFLDALTTSSSIACICLFVASTSSLLAQHAQPMLVSYTDQQEGNSTTWIAEVDANTDLDFINFHAEMIENAVELFWETPTEEKVSGYEVQRSINGNEYTRIAWMDAIGNSNRGGAYLHLDEQNFLSEMLYYRIKSMGTDGRFEYSAVQIVDVKATQLNIKLSSSFNVKPNIISLDRRELDTTKRLVLLNSKGQLVTYSGVYDRDTQLNLDNVPSGVYFVQIPLLDDEIRIEKVVKE